MTAFQSDPVEGRPDIRMFDDFQNSPSRSGVDKSEVCHFGHPLLKNMNLKLEVRKSKLSPGSGFEFCLFEFASNFEFRVSDFVLSTRLFLNDGLDRANLGTAPAIRAFVFADHVGFSFLNGVSRTFLRAGPARYAFFSDDIGHVDHLPFFQGYHPVTPRNYIA